MWSDEAACFMRRFLMRTQLDDFLINFFFLAEGAEAEQVLLTTKLQVWGTIWGFFNLNVQLNKSWCIFRGMKNPLVVIIDTTLQMLYILGITYRPCPICTFYCSTDSKLGATDTVCYKNLLVGIGASPIAALRSCGVALRRRVMRPFRHVFLIIHPANLCFLFPVWSLFM